MTATMAAFAPSTFAWKSHRSVCEYRSSSPVIFDAATSSSRLLAPLAICAVCSGTLCTSPCSRSVLASSRSAIGVAPLVVLSTQSSFSSLWKPSHVDAGTSPARASISGSRSPKLSATGSTRSYGSRVVG